MTFLNGIFFNSVLKVVVFAVATDKITGYKSSRLGSAKQNPTINNQSNNRSMQYRRTKSPGSSYFFTLVTHDHHGLVRKVKD
jgi:hypothetical protein